MTKKKKQAKKLSFWHKLFRFFFPKNWKAEFQRGKEMGSGSAIAKKIGGGMFEAGKAARKKVDPEHKMKIGNQKGEK